MGLGTKLEAGGGVTEEEGPGQILEVKNQLQIFRVTSL